MRELKQQLQEIKERLEVSQGTSTASPERTNVTNQNLGKDQMKCPECGCVVLKAKFRKHLFRDHGINAAKRANRTHKLDEKNNKKTKRELNKAYKNKIKKLCLKVQRGDKEAEIKLQKEMDHNKLAVETVKIWLRRKRQSNDPCASSSKIKTRRSINYGNAFKTFQGGSPGMGRNS